MFGLGLWRSVFFLRGGLGFRVRTWTLETWRLGTFRSTGHGLNGGLAKKSDDLAPRCRFGAWGLGFRVQGLGFRDENFGLRVLGFRIKGL